VRIVAAAHQEEGVQADDPDEGRLDERAPSVTSWRQRGAGAGLVDVAIVALSSA
jgi:hypothetical protein